jgi:hypothetical protein
LLFQLFIGGAAVFLSGVRAFAYYVDWYKRAKAMRSGAP